MNGCFDNQLPAVVFDGVKTSRMLSSLSCQAVTIGRDGSLTSWGMPLMLGLQRLGGKQTRAQPSGPARV